jgi:NADH dehydrogenase
MILITGAGGYVAATSPGAWPSLPVRALVHNTNEPKPSGRLNGLALDWAEGRHPPDTLKPAFQDVTAVIHTVAIAIEKGERSYEKINYQGNLNVLNAARAAGARRFINLSQLGADSHLPYRFLASKGKAQEAVAGSDLDWTAFRPSVIWGPEDEFANTFARLVPITPVIFPIVGDEHARFQPVWVEDVVTCLVKSLDDPQTIRREYELGGPEVLTLEEIERRTLQALGARRVMVRFPMPLLSLIVTLMECCCRTTSHTQLARAWPEQCPNPKCHQQFVAEPRPSPRERSLCGSWPGRRWQFMGK